MPGENCGFFNCFNNRGTNKRNQRADCDVVKVSFFKIPTVGKNDSDETKAKKLKAREEWIKIVCRTRVKDADLSRQFDNNSFYLCELHFDPEDIDQFTKRKTLRLGSVPCKNLPKKSFDKGEDELPVPRRVPDRRFGNYESKTGYLSFSSFLQGVKKTILDPWKIEFLENKVDLLLHDSWSPIPKFSLSVFKDLSMTCFYYGWRLPSKSLPDIGENTIKVIISKINSSLVCKGISTELASVNTISHCIPFKPILDTDGPPFSSKTTLRSKDCLVILFKDDENCCNPCKSLATHRYKQIAASSKKKAEPAKKNAPLSSCSKEKLVASVQHGRLQCMQLQQKIDKLKKEIDEQGCNLSDEIQGDITKIFEQSPLQISPHMKLIWEQQQKLCAMPSKGRRYHPQFIRFCLSIQAKSSSAYDELSEVLILPSQRCLRNYKHAFTPRPGISTGNIERLRRDALKIPDMERFVGIIFDEMKISSGLVFNKTSGDLVGYVDLGDPLVDFVSFEDQGQFATHVLVFLVRGVCSSLKTVLSYYLTGSSGVTSFQLWPLFWDAVFILELQLNLKVIFTVSDGASQNRKFFKMHKFLQAEEDMVNTESQPATVHYTTNLAAPSRKIYFVSDVPHLIKTTRNCLLSSGYSENSKRLMWNDGKTLLWSHISGAYAKDMECGLHRLLKIGPDHINVTPFGKMRVSYAVQVLSKSMSLALQHFFPSGEANETAKLCQNMNDFFDMCNVRSTTEFQRKRNPNIKPYTSTNDSRLSWMTDVFLRYFEDWHASIERRAGEFSKEDKSKMFISQQTFEGFKITVPSIVKLIQFLLNSGLKYVLTERFMQDVVEEYFGYQRSHGRRSDNPSAVEFGYNDQIINMQRTIAPRGNVRGKQAKKWDTISDESLPRKQPRKNNPNNY